MFTPQFGEWSLPVSLRLGGRFAGRLHPVEAELTGELVPEGAVLGSQAGDLGAGGIEPLAERADACALRGECGGRWFVLAEIADEVADLVLAVEPCPGDAGGVCDCGVVHGLSLAPQLLDSVVRGRECCLVAPGVGLREGWGVVSSVHRGGHHLGGLGGRG